MRIVRASKHHIRFGKHFSISFQRTLRIPNDNKEYQLPAGLGYFPIYRVADFVNTVPFHWVQDGGGVFIPMYQSEAMWIDFNYPWWRPHAIKIGAGRVNVVSGNEFTEKLIEGENDYLVCPKQPWLDGFNMGNGTVRQFVATPLGSGHTVEAQVTGEDRYGGMQIIVYAPKPGLFPDVEPEMKFQIRLQQAEPEEVMEMGLAAGGIIRQKIYPDEYGYQVWDNNNFGRLEVRIVNSRVFQQITGLNPPPTPINLQLYKDAGIPWFKLYDEEYPTLSTSNILKNVKPFDG